MKGKNVLNIIALVLGVLAILAVFVFAPVCDGMLELANGNQVPMKCLHSGKAFVMLGIVLAILALENIWKKRVTPLPILVIGILMLVLPMSNAIGIGICVKETMACQATGLWMRIIGVVTAIIGLAGFFSKGKHDL